MIRTCNKCGFILETRPNGKEFGGVCQACINAEKVLDWGKRQNDLKDICDNLKTGGDYDCVVAVSGGKDSTVIVSTLVKEYKLKPLLVTVTDEFSHTKAGVHNIKNIAKRFNLDHIIWRCEPETFKQETLKDFTNELHPLKWIEEKIYSVPKMIAKRFGLKAVFFGENSAFQYGTADTLDYLHPASDDDVSIYFFFAFYPYSESGNRAEAKKHGFKDLDDFNEWPRQGNIENYTQQDSVAYIIQLWTKFPKFGFQRVSDMACRFVRAGELTKEQAELLIKERDWVCDPLAKRNFCEAIGITEKHFDAVVDIHANKKLLVKDVNGNWRRKDLL
jgi:hypothetical protein